MTISTATTRFAGLPVQQFTTDTDPPADPAATAWKIATDWDGGDERFVADLTALTETEWAGQVTTLLLGQWSDASDPLPTEQVVPLLAALPALTALFVGDMTFDESEISWIDWADLGAVLAATPNLETVQLRGGCTPMTGDDVVLTPPSLPRLRSLTVESGGLLPAYLTALLGADLPVLERLEVWLGTENYGGVDTVEPLAALLTGDLFPNVTSLGLRNAEIADEIAVALADAPILTRITDLDLSLGTLTDVGVDALAAGDLGAVTTLILDHHYASDAALDRLRAAHPQITISAEDRQRRLALHRRVGVSAALLLVGNPGSRRTALLTAALARAGHGAPRVVPWRTVLADGPDRAGTHLAAAFAGGAVSAVRVDSPGDDPEVDRRLRGADTCAAHGAVTTGPDWYGGFTAATTAMAAAARAAGVPATTDPRELAVLFDKAACHTVLAAAGVPVPQALDAPGAPPVTGWVDLRDRLTARGWHRVFVKPAHGSSASGGLAVQLRRRGTDLDVIARGPVELDAGRPFNTLRPGVFRGESAVAPLIDALADRRLHVERWFPKKNNQHNESEYSKIFGSSQNVFCQ